MHNAAPIVVSLFKNTQDPYVAGVRSGSWDAFARGMSAPLPATIAKGELPLWAPASFREGYRSVESVETVHALVLDVDEAPIPDAYELVHALFGLRAVACTSSSATHVTPRWRVAIDLSRPVTADEYPRVSLAFTAQLPFAVGSASKDPARQWYMAREGADGSFHYISIKGEALDVDALLALAPVPPPPASSVVVSSGTPRTSRRSSVASLLGSAWPPEGSGRHEAQRSLAGALCRDGWSESDAVEFLCDVCRVAGDEDRPKRTATVRDTYARAASGGPFQGWASLAKHVDPGVMNAARDLLNPLADIARELGAELDAKQAPPTAEKIEILDAPAKRKRITAAERAAKVGGKGLRIATGLPSVDVATRGGLLLRKLFAIGGAPGAGKTALAVQLAFRWLMLGIYVAFLAADEDADALLIRFGQLAGLSRDALENGDPEERAKLARWCNSVPLILADGDEDETLEQVSRDLREAAGDNPSALIVDSIQTARTAAVPANGSDARARVNMTVRALKHAAKVDGHLVVTTSEISKAAYRNKAQAENVSPLSAFKESGDIEYGVGLAIVLTSRHGTSELVDAVIAKNRLGPGKPEIMLKLDHARAAVTETNAADAKAADPLYFLKVDIRDAVERAYGTPMKRTNIYSRIGGKKSTVVRAINELLEAKELFEDTRGIRFPLPGDPGYVQK